MTSQPSPQRSKRWQVTGAPGYEFNDNGDFFHNMRRLPPDVRIDLGPNSGSPVRPARDDGSGIRFRDEVVCWEIYGPVSITLQLYVIVKHLDGDWKNNAPGNLARDIYHEYTKLADRRKVKAWMRPGVPASALTVNTKRSPDGAEYQIGYGVGHNGNCPGWLPVNPMGIADSKRTEQRTTP